MHVDLNKLTRAEQIICGSAIVLLIASLMPWYSKFGGSRNGWDYFFWGIIPVLLGLVMLAHIAVTNFAENVTVPDLPWPMIHMVAGIVAAILVVLKVIIGDDVSGLGVSIDLDRSFGIFLAALAAIGLAVGGFLYNQDHAGATGTAR
jgi:hypothetical protein